MTTRAEALAQQKRRDKAATEVRTLRCGWCRRAFDRALPWSKKIRAIR